jgi:N-acetylglutamate synthase-like GNAT family acetyltransferase
MSIRPLQRSDIAVAKDLLKQLGYDMPADELLLRLRCVLAANGHYAACAEHDGRVVGLVHVFERPALEKPSEAVVQALVVDNEARGKGVGRTLMGCSTIRWRKADRDAVGWVERRSHPLLGASHPPSNYLKWCPNLTFRTNPNTPTLHRGRRSVARKSRKGDQGLL